MKVLMLGGDVSILDKNSPSHARMRAYAKLLEELHLVIACSSRAEPHVEGKLFVHPAAGRFFWTRWFQLVRRGLSACRRARPHIISVQDPDYFGLAGAFLARLFHLPLQVQVHTDVFSPHYRSASWKEWLRYRTASYILPRATCIRAVSNRVADSLVRLPGILRGRVCVLPIYTDVPAIRSADRDAEVEERLQRFEVKVIAAGRFVEREKGFGLLIDAFAQVVKASPDVVLVLVGDGPDGRLYERKIRSLGLSDVVLLESWRADLASFMKSFDIYVQPSYYEGWGRGAIEAAVAGLPVIMTDVGLAGEVFMDGVDARVVPVGDTSALATAMTSMVLHPEIRARFRRAGKNKVASLPYSSFKAYCREYCETLEACVQR